MRSRRSCQDSVKPCRAWARSPTTVKLRDGQRSSSICHSRVGELLGLVHHDVRERAGEQVRVGGGQRRPRRPGRRGGRRRAASTSPASRSRRPRPGGRRPRPSARARRRAAACWRRRCRDASGIAEPLPGGVQQRQVGDGPGLRVLALQQLHLVGCRARARTAAGRPGTDQRSPTRSVASTQRPGAAEAPSASAPLRANDAAHLLAGGRRRRRLVLVDQDRRAAPPRPGRGPRCAGCPAPARRTPRPSPSAPSQTSAHGGLDRHALGRAAPRRTAQPSSIAAHQVRGRLEPATSGSGSAAASAPSGTRSRRVQVCTPSSPRLGSTSET